MSNSCDASVDPHGGIATVLTINASGPGRLELRGELDSSEVPRLRAAIGRLYGDVGLDCGGVSFIDAAGIGLLVAVHAERQTEGAELRIINPSSVVVKLLELTGLDLTLLESKEASSGG